MLNCFERSDAEMREELTGLEDRFNSYHEQAFYYAFSFIKKLSSPASEHLETPTKMSIADSTAPAEIDLDAVSVIAESHRGELLNEAGVGQLASELASAVNLLADTELPIPFQYRTRAITKRQAARYLGRSNEDSGVRWLNRCIDDGIIHCERFSRQSYVFDRRQFPGSVHHLICQPTN